MMRRIVCLVIAVAFTGFVSQALADGCLAKPVGIAQNMVTSTFGKSRDLYKPDPPHTHWGTDFQARSVTNPGRGADILAVDNASVIGAGFWGNGYGNRVALRRDNGDIITYNHLAMVNDKLKSGGAIGFSKDSGTDPVGTKRVATGDVIGVAGGTANEIGTNALAIHLHMEYITNFAGTKLRETSGGKFTKESRYLRNPESYMCQAIPHANGAGPTVAATGGIDPLPQGGDLTGSQNVPSSNAQALEAAATQPSVTDRDRYGVPDAPPYQTYAGMSESQIVEVEMLRRSLDTEWEMKLVGWGNRGLWMEIARMRGVKLWMESQIQEKNTRIEGMFASILAFKTNEYFNPRLSMAYSLVDALSVAKKVR
jgi:hypothetical protein